MRKNNIFISKDLPSKEKTLNFKYRNRLYGILVELWDYPNDKMKLDYSVFINVWSKTVTENNIYLVKKFKTADEAQFWFEQFCDILQTLDGKHIRLLLMRLNIIFDSVDADLLDNDKLLYDIYTNQKGVN